MRKFLLLTGLGLAGLVALAWLAIMILNPGPPGRIIMASGGAGGHYHELALAYKKELERFGVTLELRSQTEGNDTLKGLFSQFKKEFKTFDESTADLQAGFLKGGFSGSMQGRLVTEREQVWRERQVANLKSVGRLFYEPMWVFHKRAAPLKSLKDLKGKKIYVGTRVSGARRVILHLLKANGVTEKDATVIDEDFPQDAQPLIKGDADAGIMILPADSTKIQALLRNPEIRLMSFAAEAEAYTNRFPSLSKIILRQGAVEFAPDVPEADVTLLATSAALLVRKDLHPALVSLLTYAVVHNPKSGFDKTGEPILFYRAGEFPSANDPEFEVAPGAIPVFKSGELPLLLRGIAPLNHNLGLPFWPAAFAHQHGTQAVLLLIPLLSIILPLMRLLPMLYTWSMRRRLIYWYRQLKVLESSLEGHVTLHHVEQKQAELDRIDTAVSRMRVPDNFSNQLYDLRGHIDLVRQRLLPRAAPLRVAAE